MTDMDLLKEMGKLRLRINKMDETNKKIYKILYEEGVDLKVLDKIEKMMLMSDKAQ